MKLLHTSDWHLGARLHEQERLPEQKQFLDWLLETLRKERPEALVVSGDIYDTHTPTNAARQTFLDFLTAARSLEHAPRIVITAGNHDSAAVLRASEGVLSLVGVTVVPTFDLDHPERFVVELNGTDDDAGLVVGAIPFLTSADCANAARNTEDGQPRGEVPTPSIGFARAVRSVFDACRERANGRPVVLLGHCAVAGSQLAKRWEHEKGVASAPMQKIGGLDELSSGVFPAGADYVALGHLHIPQTVGGSECVRYSGSPIAMSFDESDPPKSVVVAEFGPCHGIAPVIRTIPVPVFRRLVTLCGTDQEILGELRRLAADDFPAFVRVFLTSYTGELEEVWNRIQEAAAQAGDIRILYRDRERTGADTESDVRATETVSLRHLNPRAIADACIGSRGLSEEDAKRYGAMLDEVFQEVQAE